MIVKGAMGFGDRLQSLKMCVKYAIKYNLQIYVDWTDSIWSHSGETFYTYFKLVNMPVLNSIDDIPADATVFPAIWKEKLKEPVSVELQTTNPEVTIGFLQDQVYDADVIVYSCDGYRYVYGDSSFFADVFRVIDHRIINKVRQRQQAHNLSNVLGVHLRGTDRMANLDKGKRMDGVNIRLVAKGILNSTKCIAVSDDPYFCQVWNARYSFPLLTEVGNLGGNEGVHKKAAGTFSVSKDALNVSTLVDFFTLASCREVLSTSNDSRFAQEAQRLSKHINTIIS